MNPKRCWCGKVVYTKKEAQTARNFGLSRRGKRRPEVLGIYPCSKGNHWHLTSQHGKHN